MCAKNKTARIIGSVRKNNTRSRKLLRFFFGCYRSSYEEVCYGSSNSQEWCGDASLYETMQPDITTLQQYADDLITKKFKVTDVYNVRTLGNVFIKSIDAFIHHTHLTAIAFEAEVYLSIKNVAGNASNYIQGSCNTGKTLENHAIIAIGRTSSMDTPAPRLRGA